MPHGLQDLRFPDQGLHLVTAVEALSPKHWTTKEFPITSFTEIQLTYHILHPLKVNNSMIFCKFYRAV